MISNAETYLAIAQEAHAEMKKLEDQARRPKQDGGSGYIITFDPNRNSFKQALIAIAFSGMYFEAAVYLAARQKFSKTRADKIDGMLYEQRLSEFGITDQALIDGAKLLREVRNDLVHEKAVSPENLKGTTIRRAQKSADEAVSFVNKLRSYLFGAP